MTYTTELAFIDPGLTNLADLLAGLRPDVEAVLLDAGKPAAGRIASALEHRRDLRAIHILAHGASGEIGFGSGPLSLETLRDHEADLAAIGRALEPGGDLRLWSCRTGEGERGEIFVSRLARATGATVAAASGLVGATALGGCWQLDIAGDEAQPPLTPGAQARYSGVMLTVNSASITSISVDSGASSSDFVTNDTILQFIGNISSSSGTGTGTLGIWLSGGQFGTGNGGKGSLVGSTTVSGNGAWSLFIGSLPDGNYTIHITNGTGTGASDLTNHSLVIDTAAPATPGTPDLTAASDSGASSTDNVTNDNTPTVTGTGEVNATVKLYDTDGTTVVGTATVNGAGSWSITSSTLADGAHTLTAKQTDLAGNSSAATTGLAVTIDTTAPAAPSAPDLGAASDNGASSTDNITNDNTPTVTGNGVAAGATVALYDTNGTTVLGTATADASGNWSITSTTLADGVHSLTAKQTDTAGNASVASPALSVTIDTVKPATPAAPDLAAASDNGGSSTDNVTNDSTPTFTGSGAEPGAKMQLFDNNFLYATTTVDGSGNWTITGPALADGVHSLVARQVDVAGNQSGLSPALAVTIDTTVPAKPGVPDLLASSDSGSSNTDNITSDNTPTFSGSGAEPGGTVTLRDYNYSVDLGTATADANGNWTITSPVMKDGIHTLRVFVTDAAGNVSSNSDTLGGGTGGLRIDTTKPATPGAPDLDAASDTGSSSTDDLTNDTTPTFSGSGAEPGATVTLRDYNYSVNLGTTTADANGNWTITSIPITVGFTHTLRVFVTDAAGNVSSNSEILGAGTGGLKMDLTPPAALAAPDLDAASDSGVSNIDNITNDTTPTVTGSGAELGATVTLYDTNGATVLGQAAADASGNWTITSSALAAGAHTLTVKQTDAAGNIGAASPGLAVTIATAAAAPGAPDLAAASDSGTSSTDNLTNDTTPTVTGGGAGAGAAVTLYDTDGATVLGSTTADASGNWTITGTALAEGAHTLAARQTDFAGNISNASPGLAVTIDTTGPAAPGTPDLAAASDSGKSSTDNVTSNKTPTVSGGAAAAGAAVTLYDTDGTTVLGTTAADASGNWTITSTTLADGAHTLTARQADAAGNSGAASPALVVTIDTAAAAPSTPNLTAASDTGISSTDNLTKDTSPTFTGTAEPGATVKLYSQDVPPPPSIDKTVFVPPSPPPTLVGSATADASGNWTITDPFAFAINDGLQYFATQTDVAGNTSGNSPLLTVTFDTLPPTAPSAPNLTAASDSGASSTDDITNDATPTVTGTGGGAGGVVTLYDTNGTTVLGTATADASGNWTITSSTLAAGTHMLKAKQSDAAGNLSGPSPNLAVTIDGTAAAPSAPDLQSASDSGAFSIDNVTNVATPTVTGSGAEAGATVKLFDSNGTTVLGTTIADAGGNWTITSSSLGAGVHNLTAKQTDIAGNTGVASSALAVTIDKTAAALGAPDLAAGSDSGASSTDDITNVTTPTFTGGGAEVGAIVQLFDTDGTTVLGSAKANGSGNWTITSTTLSEEAHTLTVQQTDVAGNTSNASPGLAVTIDKTPLAAPAIIEVVDDVAPVTGLVAKGGITDDATPTVRVKFAGLGAAAGDSVQLFDGGSTLGSAHTLTAGDIGNGYVDITTAALADGTHSFTAKITDVAGNTSAASPSFVVSVGAAAAALAIVSLTDDSGTAGDHVTSDTTPTLSGTAQAGSTVEILRDGASIGTTTADANGHWSLASAALADGTYQFTATATDAQDNTTPPSDSFAVTIDTAPPAAPTIDSVAANSGATDDQLTNDQSPTLSGTAEGGGLVEVFRDGSSIGTTTADADGHWSLTSGTLGDGTYQFTATVTDAAGNTSGESDAFALAIDATAPATPTIAAVADDSGTVGDAITNDGTPTLTGDAEAGSRVELFKDGVSVGTTTADGDGHWSFEAGTLADGSYQFTATATDAAGNASGPSDGFAVTIDTGVPAAPTIDALANDSGTAGDGVTSDPTPTLSGSAEAGTRIELFQDGVSVGTTMADGDGHWSFDVATLGDGSYQFSATATDAAGNSSDPSDGFAVTIDTAAPATPTIDNLADDSGAGGDGLTNDATPTLSGSAEAGSRVELFKDGASIGTATADGDGHWTFDVGTLGDGSYQFTATATDAAGNASGPSGNFAATIDTGAPSAPTIDAVVDDSGAAGDGVTSDATPTLSGSAEAASRVELFKDGVSIGTATADGDGHWSLDAGNLGDGSYQFTATATDAAGNTSDPSDSFKVIIDTAAPAVPTIDAVTDDSGAAGDGATSDTTPTLSGSAEAGSKVEVFKDGVSVGTVTADGDGHWSLDAGTLGDGSYQFTATATDTAGNASGPSEAFALTIDTAAPSVPTIDAVTDDNGTAGDGVTNDTTPTLSGSAEAGSKVEVFKGGVSIGTVTADGDGHWSLVAGTLADGSYQFTAMAIDKAGNASGPSEPFAVTIATGVPSTPTIGTVTDDSGTAGDGVTNDTTPMLSGNADPGSTVHLFRDGQAVGTATADEDGHWSLAAGTLGDGTYHFTATASDVAGNQSVVSADFVLGIDTLAAAPGTPDLQAASDSGKSSIDDDTNVATPTVSGSGAEAGATVQLYDTDGTTLLGSTIADDSGQWTIVSAALGAGDHTLTAKQTDLAGNSSVASPGLAVSIDSSASAPSAPDLLAGSDSGKSNADDRTNVATPTVTGSGAEAGAAVTLYDTDGTTVLGTTTADAAGKWTITSATLSDGDHTLTARQTDLAGNSSAASPGLVVTIDTSASAPSAPDLLAASDSGKSNADDRTNVATPTVTGSGAEAGAAVTLYDTDGTTVLGTTTADAAGKWTITSATLSDGDHTLTARQTDLAGNSSAASPGLVVTIDTSASAPSAPDLLAASDSGKSNADDRTNVATPTVAGSGAEAGAAVTLYDTDGTTVLGTTTADAAGTWTITSAALGAGDHTLTARQTDLAGNSSAASPGLVVTIDTSASAPSAPDLLAASDSGKSNADDRTNVATPTVAGNGAEAGAAVTLYDTDGTTVLGTTTADAAGKWTITSAALSDGGHTLTARQTDVAGNPSTASPALAVTIDTASPKAPSIAQVAGDAGAFTVVVASGGSTTDTTPTVRVGLSGTDAVAGDSVQLLNGASQLGSAVTLSASDIANGYVDITPAALGPGSYSFDATITDMAGNTSNAAAGYAVTIATALPAATVSAISDDNGASSTDGITSDRTLVIGGTATAGSVVQVFRNGTAIGTVTADRTGQWSLDATQTTLADGTYQFTAKATAGGIAGQVSSPFTVTVDTHGPAAPTLAGSSAYSDRSDANTFNASEVTLVGTAEKNSTVKVYEGKTLLGTATAGPSGTWTLTTTALADGTHKLVATATDGAGNVSAPSTTLTAKVDTTPPTLAFANDAHNPNNTATLSGTVEANSTVTIYDGDAKTPLGVVKVGANGSWSFTTGVLSDTVHSFTATATDLAGNKTLSPGVALYGNSGSNTLAGGKGNDLLTGNGASDTFVFGPNFGKDIVTDFVANGTNHDVIQIDHSIFANYAAVMGHAAQVGQDVVITVDPLNVITLKNVAKASLNAADFHFV